MNSHIQTSNGSQAIVARKARHVAAPRCDIHETDASIFVTAEMPGMDATAVEVTLERNVLTIQGRMEDQDPAGFRLLWREFEPVDYRRSFELSSDTDGSAVKASMQNGLLRVEVPKRAPAQRRIPVTSG